MLLHTGSGPSLLMSIPRDSLVADPRPRHHQDQRRLRVSAARSCWCRTIEQNTGIRVDHYVEIGFGGLRRRRRRGRRHQICPKQAMKDRRANLDIKKGCQEVDGVDGARLRAVAAHVRASATSPAPSTSARWSARSARKAEVAVDRHQPGALLPASTMAGATLSLRVGKDTGHARAREVRLRDDPRQRQERPDLRRADLRPRRPLGHPARARRCSS